jgi:sec-independent protein translocase protein TatA
MTPLFAFGMPGPGTIIILLIVGVLLFGRRLPEIGKQLGKGIVEFKKGLKGLEDEVDTSSAPRQRDTAAVEPPRPPQRVTTTAPKFEDNAAGQVTTSPTTPPAPPQV